MGWICHPVWVSVRSITHTMIISMSGVHFLLKDWLSVAVRFRDIELFILSSFVIRNNEIINSRNNLRECFMVLAALGNKDIRVFFGGFDV